MLYFLFLVGCISFNSEDTVLERSANFRPYWIGSDVKIEKGTDVVIVYTVTDVHRLEIAAQQAQFDGKAKMPDLVFQRILKTWKLPSGALGDKITSEASNHWQARLQIDRDVPNSFKATYWEYKEKSSVEGTRTYYQIWSLFNVKYWVFQDYSCGLLRKLALSSDKEISTFAQNRVKDCSLDAE
jgi:hypothetical protein